MNDIHLDPLALFIDRISQMVMQPAEPPQQVLGLHLDCPMRLKHNAERASLVRSTLSPQVAEQLESLDVYDARDDDWITDVGVSRYVLRDGARLTLNAVAVGSMEHLERLDGIRRPRHDILHCRVSGLDARRISFSANRWAGIVGVEELAVFDPASSSLWTVHAVYSKKLPAPHLSALSLYRARKQARKIIGSIMLAAAN